MRAKVERLKAANPVIDLPSPFDYQQVILDHPARFKVLACGRRWGKTVLDEYVLASGALAQKTYAYFSVTYKNLSETYRDLKHALLPITAHSSQTEGRIELQGGGLIEFWSLQTVNKDTARGRKYHGVVIDEAAFIPNADYVWNAVIRPTLSDYEGIAYLTSSTNGRNHFWEWYQRGLDKQRFPDWHSWNRPISDNPMIKTEEIATIKNESSDLYFRQEYMAEFLEGQGAVFRRIAENATLIPTGDVFPIQSASPIDGHRYVFGVDWAMQNDFTVIAVMDMNTRELVALDRFNKVDWALQRGRLKAMAEVWKPRLILAESNSIGSPNIEALQRERLPMRSFETTAMSKMPLIESLVLGFEKDELKILKNPVLMGELMAYERKISANTGRSQYSAPDGMHDDCVMALALAWSACIRNQITMPVFME